MSALDCVVSIDGTAFQFSGMEVPESIRGGGSQQLNTITLPGGARVIQALGRDDLPLTWSGVFLGGDTAAEKAVATRRCRYLDYLRIQGTVHTLTWFQYSYSVVIKDFQWDWRLFYNIPYTITFEVVQDLTQQITTAPAASPDAAITGDNTTAQGLGGIIGDSTLSSVLGTLNTAIKNVSTFANATTAVIKSVTTPLQAVEQQVQILEASSANVLQNISTFGGLFPANPVANRISKLNAEIANAQQQMTLNQLSATVGRMSKNLSLLGSPSGASIAAGGTTLFRVAASTYGDATRWSTIASANGLVDPQVVANKVLKVPTNPGPSGGVIIT